VIRINLLGVERAKAKKAIAFDAHQRITLACSLVLVLAALGIGWWYWSLDQESIRLDAELAAAQQEQARLQSVLAEVRQGEARRAQLQQRVRLIEQLRGGQSIPVQLVDHVSRSLPDMIWLTEMRQDATGLTLSGRSTTLISLSDFVANLGSNDKLLKRPIEIVNSQVETAATTPGQTGSSVDLINFTVRAQVAEPPATAAPATAAPAAGAAQ
jgi:type IV pilus assembly protein PilN